MEGIRSMTGIVSPCGTLYLGCRVRINSLESSAEGDIVWLQNDSYWPYMVLSLFMFIAKVGLKTQIPKSKYIANLKIRIFDQSKRLSQMKATESSSKMYSGKEPARYLHPSWRYSKVWLSLQMSSRVFSTTAGCCPLLLPFRELFEHFFRCSLTGLSSGKIRQ